MPAEALVDLAILIALGSVTMWMSWLGFRQAKADDARSKRRRELTFIVLGVLGIALLAWQQLRNTQSAENAKKDSAREHERSVSGIEQRRRAEQLKSSVDTRYILVNANMGRDDCPDSDGGANKRLRQMSNSDLRAMVAKRVILIRTVATIYNSTARAISREHLRALELARRLENPDMHDESAMMAYLDRRIAQLANPEFFRNRERTVGEADSVDPLWRPKDVDAFYVELERRNLESMIASFQASRYQAYGAELLSRLPSGEANAKINYSAAPAASTQISAIAADLERMAQRLPTK